ncbi:MAG: hypothetical protein JRI86_05510 [Deltaproteobacteria bacterium]|nr:hypothetical protein [Deltaproteobacteria bacterium]
MIKKRIKIYGERNAGTKYLVKLARLNFDVFILRGEARHSFVPSFLRKTEAAKDLFFRMTFSQNLGWKHAIAPDPAYLKKMQIYSNDLLFLTISKNPYSWLLSLFRRAYHQKKKMDSFEDFLTTPWETVARERSRKEFENPIVMWNEKNRSYLDLRKQGSFMNCLLSTKNKGKKDYNYYRKYYLQEQWREKLDTNIIKIINKYLDAEIMERFDYKRL